MVEGFGAGSGGGEAADPPGPAGAEYGVPAGSVQTRGPPGSGIGPELPEHTPKEGVKSG